MWCKRDSSVEHEPIKCGANGLNDAGLYPKKQVFTRECINHRIMRINVKVKDNNSRNKSTFGEMRNCTVGLISENPLKFSS